MGCIEVTRTLAVILCLLCACASSPELPGDEAIAETRSPSASPSPTVQPSPEPQLIRVPNLLGRASKKAIGLLRGLHLRINRVGYFTPSGEFTFGIKRVVSNEPAGTVLRQRPPAGKMVKRGTQVTLVVAAAPPPACDPSYPNVCIPPPPPYLNCDDVPFNNIAVVGSDPHGFDGYDNDGVGCES